MIASDAPAGAPGRRPATAVADDRTGGRHVDWAAILAGAAVAAALSLILLTFGSALGLAITSPWPGEGVSMLWFSVAAGLWLLWVQVSSFMAGGYLAGRLRRRAGDATADEVDLRDGSHGLLVWAIGTLVGAALLAGGLTSGARTTAEAVGSTATAAAEAVETPDAFSGYLTDTLFRADQQPSSQAAVRAREEAGRIVGVSLAQGEIAADDRARLVAITAQQTGLEHADVEARVAALEGRIVELREEATEAVDAARRLGVLGAFLTAAALLVSAAGAYYAAGVGGRHRDSGTVPSFWRAYR